MTAEMKRTPLHGAHKALGGKLVPFAGWELPVQYSGIIDEHKTVRTAVGIFDVSHMGEIYLRGPRAGEAAQRLVTINVGKLVDGAASYTVMCYEHGGIVDDCIIYRIAADEYLFVVNAANLDKDWEWIRSHAAPICTAVNESDATALIAVQGPRAPGLVSRLARRPIADQVGSFHHTRAAVAGVPCLVGRTGYTGEDGFEIACANADAVRLWDALLEEGRADGIKPAGLGARDTLRLEAKLSLYGNDIDGTTNPLEAGLGWVVKLDGGDFIGKPALLAVKAAGLKRRLIGFKVTGRGIARHGYPILDREGGAVIGQVTSGTTAPFLGYAVGMGYVPVAHAEPGTTLAVDCRGKVATVEVVKGPFYKRSQG